MAMESKEWTEAHLLRLIENGEHETIELDYKACESLENTDAKKNEISKDVSALANSAGGVILYGIKEVDHVSAALDCGYDPSRITKEWLEDVIHGRIHPRIQGVHINPIQLTTSSPGRVAYAVTVPQSNTCHQAHDRRYYKRFNFKSQPMEDYEIRDVMSRAKHPLLMPRFSPRFVDREGGVFEYVLNIHLMNQGPIAAHFWKLVLFIPVSLSARVRGFDRQDRTTIESSIYGKEWFKQSLQVASQVIFPEDEIKLSGIEFVYKIDSRKYDTDERCDPFLRWTIYADSMPPRLGQSFLSEFRTS